MRSSPLQQSLATWSKRHTENGGRDSSAAVRGVGGVPEMVRCPNGHIGRIDAEQADGEVSIVCPSCEFHGYIDECEEVLS